jgi:hypothetical protein
MTTRRIVATALAIAVAAAAAACSDTSSESPTASTSASQTETGRAAARGGLYDTTWPVPTADSWRTSSTATGGLPDYVTYGYLGARCLELGPVRI